MLPLLLHLRNLGWRRALALFGGGVLLALALQCWRQRQELQRLRLAYDHPKTVEVVREVRVQGPERVVVRVVREPSGRVETTSEVTRGPVVTTRDGAKTSEPVFEQPARTSGWILGGGADGWTPYQTKDVAFYGGYRFGGRLDILGRVTGAARAGLVILWRF
jgi:hypothetical protein